VPELSRTGGSKASKYEGWLQTSTLYYASVRPRVEAWWCNLRAAVDASHDEYLHVGPLQRPCICPQTSWAEVGAQRQVEYKYRPYLLQAMPESVKAQALAARQLSCSELVFAVCVEAGPGALRDRAATLKAVERRGNPAAPARGEAVAPDPTIQFTTLRTLVSKMAEADEDFKFRMSNWQFVQGLSGAASCSQSQIDEFWRPLAGEAREVPTDGARQQQRRQQQQQQPQHIQQLGKKVQAKVASLEAQIAFPKGAGKGGGQPLKPGPKGKAGGPTKGKNKGKDAEQSKFCQFFESDAGCKQGGACAWPHRELQASEGKCFNCGSKGRSKGACSRPKREAAAKAAERMLLADTVAARELRSIPVEGDPGVETRRVDLQAATGSVEARMGEDDVVYVESDAPLQPLFSLGIYIEECGLGLEWAPEACGLRLPDHRCLELRRAGGSIFIEGGDAEVLQRLRAAVRLARGRAVVAQAIRAAASLAELAKHRSYGRPALSAVSAGSPQGACARATAWALLPGQVLTQAEVAQQGCNVADARVAAAAGD
ncbi:unnamed protein product, partial [Prorocentrum cordatum]